MNHFAHIPDLDVEPYTNYFINEFIPSRNFEVNMKDKGRYVQYNRQDFANDPIILELDKILRTRYRFPPIQYFIIFKHTLAQPIHIDGIEKPRICSLNLPLSGYESTKMIFYKVISGAVPSINDANYYSPDDVQPVSEFECKNEWVLVESGVPHNVTNINPNNPRYTLCIRFFTNPTFEFLVNRMNGPA